MNGRATYPAPDRAPRKMFRLPATEPAVRSALGEMRRFCAVSGLDEDACGTAEIVLAEVLNNVAEHAFADGNRGDIRVTLQLQGGALTAEIIDAGAALPGHEPPKGKLPPLDGSTAAMPEGGFGWFLIRTLTDGLSYRRQDGENHLRLRIDFDSAKKRAEQSAGQPGR